MSTIDYRDVLITVFTLLHQSGFELGVGELLAIIKVAEGDFDIKSEAHIQNVARLLARRPSGLFSFPCLPPARKESCSSHVNR